MNGPAHYAEAERLLGTLPEMQVGADTAARIALAQVHATLAVAASNVIYNTTSDSTGWMEILE